MYGEWNLSPVFHAPAWKPIPAAAAPLRFLRLNTIIE